MKVIWRASLLSDLIIDRIPKVILTNNRKKRIKSDNHIYQTHAGHYVSHRADFVDFLKYSTESFLKNGMFVDFFVLQDILNFWAVFIIFSYNFSTAKQSKEELWGAIK